MQGGQWAMSVSFMKATNYNPSSKLGNTLD